MYFYFVEKLGRYSLLINSIFVWKLNVLLIINIDSINIKLKWIVTYCKSIVSRIEVVRIKLKKYNKWHVRNLRLIKYEINLQ